MKKLMLLALGLAGLVTLSCQSDFEASGSDKIDSNSFRMITRVEGHATGATRAIPIDPQDGEENLESLYLLFFDESNNQAGEYRGAIKLENLVMNQELKVDMSGNPSLDPLKAYNILAVANLDQYAPYMDGSDELGWLFWLNGKTEGYIYKNILTKIEADLPLEADKLIMTGQACKPSGGLATMELVLTRGVVRFDVVNSARDSYDLVSVSIWNAFPESSMFGGGLVDYGKDRIQRFYGVDNENSTYPDMFGSLYAYPNQVVNPEAKDTKTTCLIVGLKETGTSNPVSFHRVNISAEDAMQNLKRNNVYRLTIRSVSGPGAGSEEEAYTGGTNKIKYQINYWDLDDDGLIQQNGNIILGIPSKRIKLGVSYEERSLDVFAFGGAAGEQIVVSTSWDGNAGNFIDVTQSGNTINVEAQPLLQDEERTGIITITYAGLTASIAVIQTGEADKFLRVTTSSGSGVPPYPGFVGAPMDGTLSVEASGSWTANIYNMEPQNFSFDRYGYVDQYSSSSLTETLNIYTHLSNSSGVARNAFVLISLDDDSETYSSAIVLTQRAMSDIAVSPNRNAVSWDGLGMLLTPTEQSSTTEFTFKVITTYNGFEYEEWEPVLSGTNSDKFSIVAWNYDDSDLDNNYVTIKANGETTAGSYDAVLRIQDKTDPITIGVDIELNQTGYTMGVTQPTTAVSNKGGNTSEITVTSNGTSLKWTAKVISTVSATGVLTDHRASIFNTTTNEVVDSTVKNDLTDKFVVRFPKLLYGNHKLGNVTATVKVTLWSGNNAAGEKTITVTQSELKPNNISISNYHGSGANYGNLYSGSDHYSAGWRTFLFDANLFSTSAEEIPAYPMAPSIPMRSINTPNSLSRPTAATTTNPVPSTTTYVHFSRASQAVYNDQSLSSASQRHNFIETWRARDYGVLFFDQSVGNDRNTSQYFPISLSRAGVTVAGNADNNAAKTVRDTSDKKIRDFIYFKGPFGPVDVTDGSLNANAIHIDGTSQSINVTGSPTAVAILGDDTRCSIMIDPTNRIVYVGEGQIFGRNATAWTTADMMNTDLTTGRSRLLANIQAYLILTAQYGSNFSDLFID